MSDEFGRLRAAIDMNDRVLVAAVNERLRLVAELWSLKRELGIDLRDAAREQDLRNGLAAANEGPLSAAGVERLVTELLSLTKDELGRRPAET